jgi:hypothetical protein
VVVVNAQRFFEIAAYFTLSAKLRVSFCVLREGYVYALQLPPSNTHPLHARFA